MSVADAPTKMVKPIATLRASGALSHWEIIQVKYQVTNASKAPTKRRRMQEKGVIVKV